MQDTSAIDTIIFDVKKTTLKNLQDQAQDILQQLNQYNSELQTIEMDIRNKKPESQIAREINAFADDGKNLCLNLENFKSDLKNNKVTICTELGESTYEWILQNVRLLQQYSSLIPAELADECPLLNGKYDSLNTRDKFMAENLMWIKTQHKDAKIVLWAHSGHVQAIREFGVGSSAIADFTWVTLGKTPFKISTII